MAGIINVVTGEMKSDKKICNRLIMAINSSRPLSKQDKRRDYAFAIFFVALTVCVPLISIPWLMTIHKPASALAVSAVSIGTAMIVGISRRRKIIRAFYRTEDAHKSVSVEDGNDKLEDLLKTDEVLVSTIPQKDCYIDVLYNWLCWRKLIVPGEQVIWYTVDADKLQPFLNIESDLSGQEKVLAMMFKDRLPDDVNRFYIEAEYLGVYLMNNIKV
ncbi:MAG: hypothetical protein IIT86_02940 [Oscillospiraceae bacterium]|nr:hypothetical protein [Oscillospiraceae bacterium]